MHRISCHSGLLNAYKSVVKLFSDVIRFTVEGDVIFLYCYVDSAGLPILMTAQEEAVLCGSAILAAAASGLKVNTERERERERERDVGKGERQKLLKGRKSNSEQ